MTMHASRSPEGESSRDESGARYKYQRLRDRLRQAILAGELSGKLPGERELARRYEANAKTINKALCDLTTEGLLIRHVGRGTFVFDGVGPAVAPRRKLHTYAWLVSDTHQKLGDSAVYRSAETLLRDRGHRLTAFHTKLVVDGEIAETAITPGHLRSWDGLVLASRTSDRLLAELHRRHLPIVMVQNKHARIRTSVVLPDYAQGAFELAQFLVRLGHRRIRLLITLDLLPAASAAEGGYRAALQRNQISPEDSVIVEPDANWASALTLEPRPTAVICVGADPVTRILAEAMRAGLDLPGTLSLCAILEPGRRLVEPSITTYEVPAETIAHWTVELLLTASPGQLPRVVIVPGHLTDRGSLAAPTTAAVTGSGNPSYAIF